MRKYIVLLIGFVFTINCFGQEMPKIIPPSPEAANAFKFTEIPVSLYTGLPNIDIPLFEIESGGVTVPISISYHARGIQVAEIASRVGLGWTLNAGGMISKQVRDKDDQVMSPCYNYPQIFVDSNYRMNTSTNLGAATLEFCDLYPDQYSFSVNGMSGKITNGIVQNYSNIKFLSGHMIDGSGNKYFFGENNKVDIDQTMNTRTVKGNGTYDQGNQFIAPVGANTFHLTTIETVNRSAIHFNYDNEITYYYKRSSDSKFAPNNESHVSYIKSDQQKIESIIFDKGKVEFEYSETNREDMPGASYLKKIILKDKTGDIVKQAIFDYQYTTSSDEQNMNWYFTTSTADNLAARKRLFLKSVQIADKVGDTLPAYRFEYDDTVLPSRHSNSVDVWGYYNGKNNGPFLERGLDDRTVDVEKVQAGMLKTVIKPEGGRTNFYYEPNTAVNVFPDTVWFDNPNPSTPKSIILSNLSAPFIPENIDPETGLYYYNNNGVYTNVFTISEYQTGPITYNASGIAIDACNCNSIGCPENVSPNASCLFNFIIEKWNPDYSHFAYHTPLYPGTRNLALLPGTYRLKVSYNGTQTHNPFNINEEFFSIYISWKDEVTSFVASELTCLNDDLTGTKVVHAAGNRIKKIEYKKQDDTIDLVKTYEYVKPNTSNTSGRVLGLTSLASVSYFDMNGQQAILYNQDVSIASMFNTYQNNVVGYKYVTEYLGDGTSTIGKTDYAYTMVYDTGKYYEFPNHPPTDNEWLRGKELSVTHYKKVGNGYEIVQKKENTYLLADEVEYSPLGAPCNNPFLKPSVILPMAQNFSPNGGYVKDRKYFAYPLVITPITSIDSAGVTINRYKTYYMTGGTMDLKKTKITDYLGGNEVVTTTDYGYNYDRHYNLSYSQQTSSDGSVRLNHYLYAQSLELENDAITAALIAKNMVGIPIQKEVRENTTVKLSTEKTIFKDWGNGILAPEIVQTSKGNIAALENRVKYNKYDDKGNLLEVQKENGTKISYIYGYNQTLPVAKIENIGYDQIPVQAIDAIHNNTAISPSNDGSTAPFALENLRSSLSSFPNVMITTLTYKPLIGVSTITDPKGQITTYEYDSFGRLERVKDHLGNILSESEYHYKPQN